LYQEFFDDYRNKSKLALYFNLLHLTALGALKDMNMEALGDNSDPKALENLFNKAIDNWVNSNPDKAAEIAVEIVAVVKEYESLRGKLED